MSVPKHTVIEYVIRLNPTEFAVDGPWQGFRHTTFLPSATRYPSKQEAVETLEEAKKKFPIHMETFNARVAPLYVTYEAGECQD